ncbi:MAG: ECF transporter S component [Anaerovoracaceae bacterium]
MNNNFDTKKLVYAGLFLALGILLPQVFHFIPVGPNAGKMFLPMHIPVLLAGFMVGPMAGLLVGVMSPILSFAFFGMPPVFLLPAMVFELAAYGLVSGILNKNIKSVYLSLTLTLIVGRVVSAVMYVVLINLFGLKMLSMEVFFASLVMGLPGIAIQLVLIPVLVKRIKVNV